MTLKPETALVWFRDDLRVADNPALAAALSHHVPVIALYVLDEESAGIRPLGGAAKWWLHYSLAELASSLAKLNIPLVLRRGSAGAQVDSVVTDVGATSVSWNRRYGGPERKVDTEIKKVLTGKGVEVESYAATLLFEPWTIQTLNGGPYSMFTPFWRACTSHPSPRQPFPAPGRAVQSADLGGIENLGLDSLNLLPKHPDWAEGLRSTWNPGEAAAQRALRRFGQDRLGTYSHGRDLPSRQGTSRLSPHLRWGELSPHQVWHAAQHIGKDGNVAPENLRCFLRELGWREFAWHTLYHFPELATRNWRSSFDDFPWPELRPDLLRVWQQGRTGVALVDAGMRELWRTGWMHNRVRMVAASFLCKNLLIDWREGEAWFWDTLVDADAASNPFNWQWVAGSGADAAPYFRIFNPELQAKKVDPDAIYIRANIEEWGTGSYPDPVVDLGRSRAAALAAYDTLRSLRRSRTDADMRVTDRQK